MTDREKQIEELEKKIDEFCSTIDGECEVKCSKCLANFLINENYRKMDEVTLKLDLGDRSPKEIKQIVGMFKGVMAKTPLITVSDNEEEVAKRVAKEIIQIMKQVQAMFYDKEYVAIQNLIAEKYGVEVDK